MLVHANDLLDDLVSPYSQLFSTGRQSLSGNPEARQVLKVCFLFLFQFLNHAIYMCFYLPHFVTPVGFVAAPVVQTH